MRLQTASLLLLMSILWVQYAVAQYVQTNPLEWMALAEGNEAINGEIELSLIHISEPTRH